jgi:8-oxo-dGTP pyrophosphatase MutT (NUDIX family)
MGLRKRYVLGFVCDPGDRTVLLVRKDHPFDQAGRLNGLGGAAKVGEHPEDAVCRGAHEEAGLDTTPDQWKNFAIIGGDDWLCYCFTTLCHTGFAEAPPGRERLERIKLGDLVQRTDLVRGVIWLVPLACDHEIETPVLVNYP